MKDFGRFPAWNREIFVNPGNKHMPEGRISFLTFIIAKPQAFIASPQNSFKGRDRYFLFLECLVITELKKLRDVKIIEIEKFVSVATWSQP